MSEAIHDDELDTSEPIVRELLELQLPDWSEVSLSYVRSSGTSNAMWRVHRPNEPDVVVRLPRQASTEASFARELELLPAVALSPLARIVRTPHVAHVGEPTDAFPCRWAVLDWLDGSDAWTARDELQPDLERLAIELAGVVRVMNDLCDLPAPHRDPGERGGPLEPILDLLDRWLDDPMWNAAGLLDVAAVRRCAAESAEVVGSSVTIGFLHGDLIPGNLLVVDGRLSAIIDWGSAGYGDTAEDVVPAWAVFDAPSRAIFREAVGVSGETWLRARAFALEQAVGGVLYYTPRRHPLGDVMARMLHHILDEG